MGIPALPRFYARPLNLCSACVAAQEMWLEHWFMLDTERRLNGGRVGLIRVLEADWGAKAVDMLALLYVAYEDLDLARRVVSDSSFTEIKPWLEGNIQRGFAKVATRHLIAGPRNW